MRISDWSSDVCSSDLVAALDLEAWWRDVEELTPVRRDLHIAMMLSGARRSSLLQVRRDDVDLDRAVLTFRHMKTGGQMLFPMGTRLAEAAGEDGSRSARRSEEHTSELQSLMRISYAVFCLKKKKTKQIKRTNDSS